MAVIPIIESLLSVFTLCNTYLQEKNSRTINATGNCHITKRSGINEVLMIMTSGATKENFKP